jgi:hypothetical protein
VLAESGRATIRAPLVKFLTVALVRPSATRDIPLTVQAQAGLAGYVPSPAVVIFRHDSILYWDLSGLQPTTAYSSGVRDFVSEGSLDRADRVEAREVALMKNVMRERLSNVITDRLLLL